MPQDTIQWLGTKNGEPAGPARITRTSPLTKQQTTMDLDITFSQWELWQQPNSPLIQQVFPQLTGPEREFIQTGFTPADWEKMWGKPTAKQV